MGTKTVEICCGSCESHWRVPAIADSGYAREALESQPCPTCGLHTMRVVVPEPIRRTRLVQSFIIPRIAASLTS